MNSKEVTPSSTQVKEKPKAPTQMAQVTSTGQAPKTNNSQDKKISKITENIWGEDEESYDENNNYENVIENNYSSNNQQKIMNNDKIKEANSKTVINASVNSQNKGNEVIANNKLNKQIEFNKSAEHNYKINFSANSPDSNEQIGILNPSKAATTKASPLPDKKQQLSYKTESQSTYNKANFDSSSYNSYSMKLNLPVFPNEKVSNKISEEISFRDYPNSAQSNNKNEQQKSPKNKSNNLKENSYNNDDEAEDNQEDYSQTYKKNYEGHINENKYQSKNKNIYEDENSEDDREIVDMYMNKIPSPNNKDKNSVEANPYSKPTRSNSNTNVELKQLQNSNHISKENTSNSIKNTETSSQPSSLIKKYFKVDVKPENPTVKKSVPETTKASLPDEYSQATSSIVVNEKLKELSKEFNKLKSENEKVAKLKFEYEKLNKKLITEMQEWTEKKEQETKDFEQWKEEEIKKLKKEKKVQEKNLKQLTSQPNRKEREEIEALKAQVVKLTEEMKAKDTRNKLNLERLKKQYDEQVVKNAELEKELKFLEEQRIKSMSGINKLIIIN